MAGNIDFPFNFQAESATVYTGNYTIPAGKYAFVTVQCRDDGIFLIDGNATLKASEGEIFATGNVLNNSADIFTVASGRTAEVSLYASATGAGASDVIYRSSTDVPLISTNTFGSIHNVKLAGGDKITISAGVGDSITGIVAGKYIDKADSAHGSFWLKENNAITVIGEVSYTVSLFTNVS